ncbi:helix-turn-helix domain-containing protein [Streptomyces sp. NPDC001002]
MTRPLSPEGARLAAALRELRERSGLTLAGLAAKTTYSKSSWERYLNGKTLPPRPAVEELCRIAGEPDGRCVALWEIAESEWGGRAREDHRQQPPPPAPPAPSPPPPPEPAPPEESAPLPPTGHRRAALALAVLATLSAVLAAIVTVALVLLPRENAEPSPPATPTAPLCHASGCAGKDPMHLKCAAAPTTLAQYHTATGAWMEVRYSKACGTSWARMWGTRLGDRLEVTPGDGTAEVKSRTDTDAYVYTLMTVTRPGTVVRACFVPATPGARSECVEGRVE